jgi:hypothetical protein
MARGIINTNMYNRVLLIQIWLVVLLIQICIIGIISTNMYNRVLLLLQIHRIAYYCCKYV